MFLRHLLILLLFVSITQEYKILVVNVKIGYSHANFMSQIADTLVDAGHNVTVLTVDMDPTVNHPGSYKAKVIRYPSSKKLEEYYNTSFTPDYFWNLKSSGNEQFKLAQRFMAAFQEVSTKVFNDNELTKMLRKEEFDVGMVEALGPFFPGMLKVWGVKTTVLGLSMSLFDKNYGDYGLHFPASHIPTGMSPFTDVMTYTERVENLFIQFMGKIFYYFNDHQMSLQYEFDNKYGKGFFDKDKIIADSSFILINSNPFIDYPGPKTAKMIEVSGIGIKDSKPLDDYWNKILSLRSKTILISFGTIAKSSFMPEDMKNGLLQTVKKFNDITFIWKYETPEDGTGKGIENLILSKWLPQSDLLNDKRLTLFITHGGLGSTTEVFFRGVPVVAIPILGDQLRNVKLFEKHEIGLIMGKEELSKPEVLEKKIKQILEDEKYRKNAENAAKRLKKRPFQPKELVVKYVEFAADVIDLSVLDLASRKMGFIEFYNLDIIIPFLLVKAKIITYPSTQKIRDYFVKSISPDFFWNLESSGTAQFEMLEKFMDAFYDMSTRIFNDRELTETLRKEKFDVGITEALSPFFLGMFKVWGVKTTVSGLSMSLLDKNYKDFGLDFPSSYLPTAMAPFSDKMSYMERCSNLFIHILGKYMSEFYEYKPSLQKEFDEKYGKNFYNWKTIVGDSSFFILNSNPLIDYPGPKTAKMIEVSGIGIKDIKPLNEYWSKTLSLRQKTVLISFGTIAKSSFMPTNLKNGLLETIRRLKNVTFIWKYESPEDADTLVDAGHNVTVLTIGVDPTVNHPGSYKAKIIYYPATKKIENYFINSFTPDFYWNIKSSGNDQLKVLEKLMASYYDTSVNIFNDDDLAEILRREKYDVGICEALSSFFPGMLKAWGVESIVSVTSMSLFDQAYQNFGLSFPASYMPASMSQFTDKMTYVERCQNLFLFFLGKYFFYVNNNKMSLQEEFDKKYGKGFFDSLTIVGDSSFYIVNSNPFIDIPGPMTAKMIEVSGIGIKDIEPLDKFWDEILSLRSKTILISFGTMAKSSYMPKNLKNGLLETIKRMKDITFIWKYESPEDGTGEGIENLILSKWFPQSDLLNDKRLTL
uniref:glucuronosyltransferase n=1 Tax=Parastrongyloides trichosuri TaxID=131310 RepID=A0A0N5A5S8_PARTI